MLMQPQRVYRRPVSGRRPPCNNRVNIRDPYVDPAAESCVTQDPGCRFGAGPRPVALPIIPGARETRRVLLLGRAHCIRDHTGERDGGVTARRTIVAIELRAALNAEGDPRRRSRGGAVRFSSGPGPESMSPRNLETKGAALAGRTLHRDRAAMKLHDMLHDREPEPRSALLARARLVHAVEAFEDPRLVRVRNSVAGVDHLAPRMLRVAADHHGNLAALRVL